jgi:3-hydroxyisobutyrate dehydrogenase-like beta-hydroxyacid dehydrogenase
MRARAVELAEGRCATRVTHLDELRAHGDCVEARATEVPMNIGFVGLGRMGYAMASRLIGSGHSLVVYNRTRDKAAPLATCGAVVVDTPEEAAEGVDVLVTMLSDDAAVEALVLGERGAIHGLRPGAIHVSTSTIGLATTRLLARAHREAGQRYVAAPVLGRPDAAERGTLVIIAAGPRDAIAACRGLLGVMGSEVHVVGVEQEKANVLKLAVNFALATLLEALGEAYALAEGYGIDDTTLLDVLNGSLLKSPVIDRYGHQIAKDQFEPQGFRLRLGAKDVRLVVEAAEGISLPMPIASVLRDRFVAAIAQGHEDDDWAAVGRVSTGKRGTRAGEAA